VNELEFTIEGQVLAQKNQKKVSCQGGKPRIYTAPAVKAWQEDVAWQLKQVPSLQGEVIVTIELYNKDKRPRDIDNMSTSILDAIVKADIIEEDNCNIVKELHVVYGGIDKENPRANLTITRVNYEPEG